MARKTKDRGARPAKFFRPWLCVAGLMLLWAAQNQPQVFTPANLAIWALSSLAVGLVAGGVCAFVQPLFAALARAWRDLTRSRASGTLTSQLEAAEALAGQALGRADEP